MAWKLGRWQGTREQLIDWLANLRVEPYWVYGAEPGKMVQLRAIPVPGRKAQFHGKAIKGNLREEVLRNLGLMGEEAQRNMERVKHHQTEIRRKAGIRNAPFGWRDSNV